MSFMQTVYHWYRLSLDSLGFHSFHSVHCRLSLTLLLGLWYYVFTWAAPSGLFKPQVGGPVIASESISEYPRQPSKKRPQFWQTAKSVTQSVLTQTHYKQGVPSILNSSMAQYMSSDTAHNQACEGQHSVLFMIRVLFSNKVSPQVQAIKFL